MPRLSLSWRVVGLLLAWCLPSVIYWLMYAPSMPFYPLFDAEMMLPLALMIGRRRLIFFLTLVGGAGIASAQAIAALFHFPSALDLVTQGDVPELSVPELIAAYWKEGLPLIAAAGVTLVALRLRRPTDRSWMLPALVLVLLLDLSRVTEHLRPSRYGAMNAVGSPLAGLVVQASRTRQAHLEQLHDARDLRQDALTWADSHPDGRVVWLLVESLGLPVDSSVRSRLDDVLAAASGQGYQLEVGSVPFRGSTTAGELRRLCQLAGSYSRLDMRAGRDCIPEQLRARGWHTTGLHAFSGLMFQRARWWPLIGLQDTRFLESLGDPLNSRRCGTAFRGLCDEDLVTLAFAEPIAKGGHFTYLLTLNTHLPLPERALDEPLRVGSPCDETQGPHRACELLHRHASLLQTVGEAAARQAEGRRPLIIIVGDHSPPFVSHDDRGFFDQDQVPFWILRPPG
ncbi:MAG: hypothetical protein RLZZ182_454 [Pseudomonadota bacterium]|jgi:hypothetical protein